MLESSRVKLLHRSEGNNARVDVRSTVVWAL